MGKTTTPTGVEDPRGIEVAAALVRLRNAMEDQRGPQRSAVRALIARAHRRCAEGTRADRRKGIMR
ncbi:hypothetical protein QU668_04005 [Schaalia sp. HMT-877]|nr:hypothetical protein HMPREF1550_00844 [Actinomyces sp. oral taxon 877 str. F0543]WLD80911.1 hypothetical protein QU668_04005 [Schaalia sp. HMT-877]